MKKHSLDVLLAVLAFTLFAIDLAAEDSSHLIGGGQVDYSFRLSRVYPPIEESFPPMAIQADGKFVVVGKFSVDTLGSSARKLYRFFPNGTLDNSFNPYYPVPNIRIIDVALQSDGKIVYIFTINDNENYTTLNVVRLNSDGSQDASFNFVPYYRTLTSVFGILTMPDGKLMISASFVSRGEMPHSRSILRINNDGTLDQNYIDAYSGGYAAKFQLLPDGNILARSSIFRRLNSNGSLDATFPTQTNAKSFHVLSDGKILLSKTTNALIRILPDGTIDTGFSASPTLTNYQMGVKSNGEIILSSYICNSGVVCRTTFEHLNMDGLFKRRFDSAKARGVMTVSPDNKIYFQGQMLFGNTNYGMIRVRTEYTPTRRKAFDFDGDGKSDISVYRPSEGIWYIYYSSTSSFAAFRFGVSEDKPVPADYDGDTIGDIAVFRPSNGTWYILRSSDGQVSIIRFGLSEDIPTPNDYDGDQKDDISLYRPSSGVWYRINSADGSVVAREFGGAIGDRPVSGDYDGDGISDLAIWKTSDSTWNYFSSITNTPQSRPFSFYETDIATPADFDGDSILDFARFKHHDGSWSGMLSGASGFYLPWGLPGDIPVPADYDGDGRDDLAVWRPSTGDWWIGQTSNGQFYSLKFGTNGDIPIPSTYVR